MIGYSDNFIKTLLRGKLSEARIKKDLNNYLERQKSLFFYKEFHRNNENYIRHGYYTFVTKLLKSDLYFDNEDVLIEFMFESVKWASNNEFRVKTRKEKANDMKETRGENNQYIELQKDISLAVFREFTRGDISEFERDEYLTKYFNIFFEFNCVQRIKNKKAGKNDL